MEILDAFRGKSLLSVVVFAQGVVQVLDHPPIQLIQPDITKDRTDVPCHRALIVVSGGVLDADGVILQPDIQPFIERHGTGINIGLFVDFVCDFADLLADFLLRISVNRALNLLAGLRIEAHCIPSFPASIRTFSNRPSAVCGASAFLVWQLDLSFLGIWKRISSVQKYYITLTL